MFLHTLAKFHLFFLNNFLTIWPSIKAVDAFGFLDVFEKHESCKTCNSVQYFVMLDVSLQTLSIKQPMFKDTITWTQQIPERDWKTNLGRSYGTGRN